MARLTIEHLWRDFDFTPNEKQREAILHTDGPLYLPAGPGSGKTRVLLWRSLNLIVFHDVSPDEIYLSTFTEKAALQLKEGLQTLLAAATNPTRKPYDIARMFVGTVHSLCQRILTDRRFYPNRQRGRAPVLLDELDQYLHLSRRRYWTELASAAGFEDSAEAEINHFLSGTPSQSRHTAVSNVIALFNRLSEECIDPAQVARRERNPTFKKLLQMYGLYRDGLGNPEPVARTDFALLQRHAFDVLGGHADAGRVFRHVIVDEYQDTNTIQERIFFRLAAGHGNMCIVGDDDQALYRFRGATVENFVQFPYRCRRLLGVAPAVIPLVTNYRSRRRIVSFYGAFIDQCDWSRPQPEKGSFRVTNKKIQPHRTDDGPSVVASTPSDPHSVTAEIAKLVKRLLRHKRVADPNQVAFLYPSLKSPQVQRMMAALESEGLRVYAPRAKPFLEGEEATAMLGLMTHIVGRPARGVFPGHDYASFHGWLDRAWAEADRLLASDRRLERFVTDREQEIEAAAHDYSLLRQFAARKRWDPDAPFRINPMKRGLYGVPGLSDGARRGIASARLDRVVQRREQEGNPVPLEYVLRRATSIDWTVLDLFYRLCGFGHFIAMFDAAQHAEDPDEGPVANLALLSNYLARFVDQRAAIITGPLLQEEGFARLFFGSYLYALYKRGETEDENEEDPFPKGRIPFLTIHQSKGLEFPVVVLGNPRKQDRGPQRVEELVRPHLPPERQSEPLDRLAKFDIMRMFYVALSRAKNLLVIPEFVGRGQSVFPAIQGLLDGVLRISDLDVRSVPCTKMESADTPSTYSYTGDYLAYRRCPRQYMIFRKFDFALSRSQSLVFGTLVHRTMDDLHQYLINKRRSA